MIGAGRESALAGFSRGPVEVDRDGIFGSAEEVAERLSAQVRAGIAHPMIALPDLGHEQLDEIAENVVPAMRAAVQR